MSTHNSDVQVKTNCPVKNNIVPVNFNIAFSVGYCDNLLLCCVLTCEECQVVLSHVCPRLNKLAPVVWVEGFMVLCVEGFYVWKGLWCCVWSVGLPVLAGYR